MLKTGKSRFALAAIVCVALMLGVVSSAFAAVGDYTTWDFNETFTTAHPGTDWFQQSGPTAANPTGPSYSWNNEPVTLTLGLPALWETYDIGDTLIGDGTDDFPHVQLNTGVETTYTAPIIMSAEGTYQVNLSGVNTKDERGGYYSSIGIDKTRPVTSTNAKPVYDGVANITITATDTLSGANYILSSLDGEADWATATVGAVNYVNVTAGVGSHSLAYYSLDHAGNFSLRQTVSFSVNPVGYVPVLSNATVKVAKKKATFKGTVTAATSAATVKLAVDRKVGRKWKKYASYYVTVPQYAGSYSVAKKISKAGTYRVRAYQGSAASPKATTFKVK